MNWIPIVYFFTMWDKTHFTDGIELLYSSVLLQMPGHLYMHKRDTSSIFCRDHEIDFYLHLENYSSVKTELSITLSALNKTCGLLQQDFECKQLINNLWIESEGLEKTTKTIQNIYTNAECKHRAKRFAQLAKAAQFNLYQFIPTNSEHKLSELRFVLEKLLKETKNLSDWEKEAPFDQEDIGLFRHMERISITLQKNTLTNQYMADILCDQSQNALLQMITVEVLLNKIKSINRQALRDSCRIPKTIDIIDLIRLLELAEMQATLVADTFTVNLKIPSIHIIQYNLYQVISLPFAYNNKSFVIKPIYPYYLVSENTIGGATFMYPMKFEDMNSCINSTFGRICHPSLLLELTHKIYDHQREDLPDVEKCANKAPEEIFKMPNYCETFEVPHSNRIIKITNSTHYVYIIESTTMSVRCPKKDQNITIDESILIGIHLDCRLKLAHNTIPEGDDIFMKKENFLYHQKQNKTSLKQNEDERNEQIEQKENGLEIWHITLTVCFSFLFLVTWIIVGYNNRRFLEQIRRFATSWQPHSQAQSAIEFDCSFSFDEPVLPPKKRRLRRRFMNLISEKPEYDIPRENATSTSLECEFIDSTAV